MDYSEQLNCSLRAARLAAELLRSSFHEKWGPDDGVVEVQIRDVLRSEYPDYGYLGEESGSGAGRAGETHCWVVDPHDGTAAALEGFRGASVSIALLRAGTPVLGVVYAYAAPDHNGDLFWWAEGTDGIYRNNKLIRREWPQTPARQQIALVSQHADRQSSGNATFVHPLRFRAIPSIAYRLALVAAGEGDLAVSLNSPASWDVAGGHALVLGAGGDLFDQTGDPVRYQVSGETTNAISFCFGGGSAAYCSAFASSSWGDLLQGGPKPAAAPSSLVYLWPRKSVPNASLLGRAQGCLLGQLAGDSLGSLVEFQSAGQIQDRYATGPHLLSDGGVWDTIAGQPTDDSELALALARSIVANGNYAEEDAAMAYSRWFESLPFDVGQATRSALSGVRKALDEKKSAWQAARRSALPDTQANGALMRVSPLGIFGAMLNEHAVFELAAADASLTHPHRVCRDANGIFAAAIAFAIRTGGEPRSVYDFALQLAKTRHVDQVVMERLLLAGERAPENFLQHQGWVLVAFQNAFYQLLHASSVQEGVVATVRQGGDTDTNAAIAGALLGAVYGNRSLPQQWRDQLLSCRPLSGQPDVTLPRPTEYWPVDALELAERLVLCGSEVAHTFVSSRPAAGRLTANDLSGMRRLLAFLPELEYWAPDRFVVPSSTATAESNPFASPDYRPVVQQFFAVVTEVVSKQAYDGELASRWARDRAFVAGATWNELKVVLLWSTRGEHFSSGFWASALEDGSILAVLKRVEDLLGFDAPSRSNGGNECC